MFSKIIVNSPWYYFLISSAISLGLAVWLYFRNKKNTEASIPSLYLMSVLRFLSLSLILLLLLNIFFKQLSTETENPLVLIAVDNSSSMTALPDSDYVKGDFLKELGLLKSSLQDKFLVKQILFGSKSVSSEENPGFTEKETDIETLIREVENNYANQNIGALILVSDGIVNKGVNPLYSANKLKYPIYTVALGDTTELKDVAIQKVNHNQIAYTGNNFPVEVIVNAKKYLGKELTLTLFENGIQKAKQLISVNSTNFLSASAFTLSASGVGIIKYTAKVSCMEDEKNCSNNVQNFVVEVIDNKEKVLLLAAYPHPDISAIKEAITISSNYEMDYALASEFKKNVKGYSLVILHGYNSGMSAILNDFKNNQVPFWIINPSTTENLPGVKITASLNKYNDTESYTDNTFGLFSLSDAFKKFSNDLPALKTFFGNYSMGNGANVLLKQRIGAVETENPILFFEESGSSKSAVFLGDGLWKWKMRDFAEHQNHNLFNELISKSVQYLSVKSDKSFFRIRAPKIIQENESFELTAELYNKSYELITEPEVVLTLSNSENKKFNYTFSKTSTSYKLDLGLLPPGDYAYEASTKNNTERFVKKGVFTVKEVVSEKINTVANHSLLNQISKRSNGKLYYPKELDALQTEILKSETIKPITYSQTTTSSLIEMKWLFWLILILLGSEWFFRKRYLSI